MSSKRKENVVPKTVKKFKDSSTDSSFHSKESEKKKEHKVQFSSTVTITFGDRAENHRGMQIIGQSVERGFSCDDINTLKEDLKRKGFKCEVIQLHETVATHRDSAEVAPASLLIVRDGMQLMGVDKDNLYCELTSLEYDKQAFMYGRVVNKRARHNLCFDDNAQEPDYEKGKGRVVRYDTLPNLHQFHLALPTLFGDKATVLKGEANHYYDISKCGIGFHGDGERKIVIAFRVGLEIPLHFQWFREGRPVGERVRVQLGHGDVYLMSEKATGNDWKKKKTFTLRHAAGAEKFLRI